MSEVIGFTGTRLGMSAPQWEWLCTTLPAGVPFHHGGCLGSDLQSHERALAIGCPVTVHPPINPKLRMPHDPRAVWLQEKDHLPRDRDIVDASTFVLATPDGPRRPSSRTWYTIDYAASLEVPVLICYPDGMVRRL